ncbi:hypothetical protein [Caballeronia sp. Lep1P3]|uniref:hypothetical protein n=1 Tax=Caballeronia sp. Lep1P3 TaxID=2878150 RepID=UPI001FD1747A|nr:hypothetical protein [Caballeronia sp. Lep1P3]
MMRAVTATAARIVIYGWPNTAAPSLALTAVRPLAPFSALSMLAEQYGLALSQIEHLKNRLALADARNLELSKTLDAIDNLKRAPKQPSTET